MRLLTSRPPGWLPGVALAGAAALLAWLIHLALPVIPALTAAVALGLLAGQLPTSRILASAVFAPGLKVAAKRLMRVGVVLLGLKLSLGDIAELGLGTIALVIGVVLVTFGRGGRCRRR